MLQINDHHNKGRYILQAKIPFLYRLLLERPTDETKKHMKKKQKTK